MNNTTATLENWRSELEELLIQEENYLCQDYLGYLYDEQGQLLVSSTTEDKENDAIKVDADYRLCMVQWAYRVADYCNFQQGTVEIAISYLDRFMSQQKSGCSRGTFQVVAMTALYMAIKFYEPISIDMESLSKLGKSTTKEQLEAMEQELIKKLEWRLSPPTILAFVRLYLPLLPTLKDDEVSYKAVLDCCVHQAQVSVCNYEFILARASHIALMAVMNALRHTQCCDDVPALLLFQTTVSTMLGVDCHQTVWLVVEDYLYEASLAPRPASSSSSSHKAGMTATKEYCESPLSTY